LAANLILKEKIVTTEAKAKEVKPFVEKLITKSKKATGTRRLAMIRYLARYLPSAARKKIVEEIGPRFQKRPGGYTRIIKLAPRSKDGAKRAIIELVE